MPPKNRRHTFKPRSKSGKKLVELRRKLPFLEPYLLYLLEMGWSQSFVAVDILSDDEDDASCALSPSHHRGKRKSPENSSGRAGGSYPTFVVVDDDPTPQRRNPVYTPSVVAETPLSFNSDASIVKCSLARANSRKKFAGRCP